MTNLLTPGHTAVITGAALGIGRAAAHKFAKAGLNVCLVDLPSDDLTQTTKDVAAGAKGEIWAQPCDVSKPAEIAAMRKAITDRIGPVHILMNNAAARIGRGWDVPLEDWRLSLETNLWGVIEGTHAFLDHMADGGRIINTGSKQGITNPPGHPIYNIGKSAVKTYTEALEHELRQSGRLTAHLLVPGWTTTGHDAHRSGAWMPEHVVDFMVEKVDNGSFYIICPDDDTTPDMDRRRMLWGVGDIIEDRPPLSRWHAEHKDVAAKACS